MTVRLPLDGASCSQHTEIHILGEKYGTLDRDAHLVTGRTRQN